MPDLFYKPPQRIETNFLSDVNIDWMWFQSNSIKDMTFILRQSE